MKKVITHDFEDGRGEVSSHQHINPDKSLGGWVEDNCTVSDDCYISADSRVYNNSRVDNSRVYNSRVYNSKVKHTKQVFSQSPIGSRNDKATAIFDYETELIKFSAGCFLGNEQEFIKSIQERHGHTEYGSEYLAFIKNAKTYFDIWRDKILAA